MRVAYFMYRCRPCDIEFTTTPGQDVVCPRCCYYDLEYLGKRVEKDMRTRRDIILATVSDAVTDLMYYDRKEDSQLPRGAIEEAILAGEITVDEIVERFRSCLTKGG